MKKKLGFLILLAVLIPSLCWGWSELENYIKIYRDPATGDKYLKLKAGVGWMLTPEGGGAAKILNYNGTSGLWEFGAGISAPSLVVTDGTNSQTFAPSEYDGFGVDALRFTVTNPELNLLDFGGYDAIYTLHGNPVFDVYSGEADVYGNTVNRFIQPMYQAPGASYVIAGVKEDYDITADEREYLNIAGIKNVGGVFQEFLRWMETFDSSSNLSSNADVTTLLTRDTYVPQASTWKAMRNSNAEYDSGTQTPTIAGATGGVTNSYISLNTGSSNSSLLLLSYGDMTAPSDLGGIVPTGTSPIDKTKKLRLAFRAKFGNTGSHSLIGAGFFISNATSSSGSPTEGLYINFSTASTKVYLMQAGGSGSIYEILANGTDAFHDYVIELTPAGTFQIWVDGTEKTGHGITIDAPSGWTAMQVYAYATSLGGLSTYAHMYIDNLSIENHDGAF